MRNRVAAIGIGLGLCAMGCDDGDHVSAFISGALAPDRENECVVTVDNAEYFRGAMNVHFRTSYVLHPQYVSQVVGRVGVVGANPNNIFISGAVVEIRGTDGRRVDFTGRAAGTADDLPNPFRIEASDIIPAASEPGAVSEADGSLEILPSQYGAYLRDMFVEPLVKNDDDGTIAVDPDTGLSVREVGPPGCEGDACAPVVNPKTYIVSVKPFGETGGDTEIEMDEFLWPIDLLGDDDLARCLPAGSEDDPAPACLEFQDETGTYDASQCEALGLTD